MIELYRTGECAECAEIEAALREMVVAYRVITVEPGKKQATPINGASLPAIKDGEQIVSGEEEITHYLNELERFVTLWRRYQSDSCYIDENGDTC